MTTREIQMKKIVILSGAGVSAESGLQTFRASDGLWEQHKITDIATPQGWEKDPELVLNFYNERRKQARAAMPNDAHKALAALEQQFDVTIITQNVDDLHERAGSSHVMHLHGEINQSRSSMDPELVYEIDHWEVRMGDLCEKGSQLRPNIVWFGEDVPMINLAVPIVTKADIFMVIGTSLNVYPAAGLVDFVATDAQKYHIDPNGLNKENTADFHIIAKKAGEVMPALVESLLKQ